MSQTLMSERLLAERLMADRVMGTGTVRWFSPTDVYGLISPDEGDDDVVVHAESVAACHLRELIQGARVEFDVHAGRRGLEAFSVVPI